MSKKKADFVTITNEDVYKELQRQGAVQKEILDHAKYTNGKIALAVQDIEKLKKEVKEKADKVYSFGHWVREHTVQSMAATAFIVILFISETRHAAIEMITKLFL